MKIMAENGMVTIDTKNLSYCNIKGMYKDGESGSGLQNEEFLNEKRQEILEKCGKIANLIYEIQEIEKT
jgi:hypothetical protein